MSHRGIGFQAVNQCGGPGQQDPTAQYVAVEIKREGNVIIIPKRTVAADRNMELETEEDEDDLGCDDNGDGQEVKPPARDTTSSLLSHCIFCLRETIPDKNPLAYQNMKDAGSETLRVVPRAHLSASLSSRLVSVLNQLWPYLQQQQKTSSSGNPLGFMECPADDAKVFSALPTLCLFCADNLQTVNRLFTDLLREMDKFGNVIRKSRYGGKFSWRAEHFQGILADSTLEAGPIQKIMEFFGIQKKAKENKVVECNVGMTTSTSKRSMITPQSRKNVQSKPKGKAVSSHPVIVKVQCTSQRDQLLDLDPLLEHENEAPDFTGNYEDSDDKDIDPDYIKSEPESNDEWDSGSPAFSEMNEEPNQELIIPPSPPTEAQKKRRSSTRYQDSNKKRRRRRVIRPDEGESDGESGSDKPTMKKTRGNDKQQRVQPTIKCDLCQEALLPSDIHAHVLEHVGEDYCIKCPNNPDCPLVCGNILSMYRHLRQNKTCRNSIPPEDAHQFKLNTCHICKISTKKGSMLRCHLKEKHETDSKDLKCPISGCERVFSLKQSVTLHLPFHDFSRDVTTQPCDHCGMNIKCTEMERHLKDNHHQVKEIIKCNQCACLFSSRELLLDHLFVHRFGVLICDICNDGVKYPQHSNLRDHYIEAHQIGQKKFKCDECSNVYWTKSALFTHKKTSHDNGDKAIDKITYNCMECGKKYRNRHSLKYHNIVFHGATAGLECNLCSKQFSTNYQLQSHRNTKHRGLPAKAFSCQVEGCSRVFVCKKSLDRHHSVDHLGLREQHVCELCGKTFAQEGGLKYHKDSVHLRLRPFVCSVCGDSFQNGSVLKRHMLIHTGERPFVCDICGQRFRHRDVLKTHMEGHVRRRANFKPNGPMKHIRKRVQIKKRTI